MQSAAEGGQGVHGLLVVESKDGVHATGELGANCGDGRNKKTARSQKSLLHDIIFVNNSVEAQLKAMSDFHWLHCIEFLFIVTFVRFFCQKVIFVTI